MFSTKHTRPRMLSENYYLFFTETTVLHLLPKSGTRPFTEFHLLCVLKPRKSWLKWYILLFVHVWHFKHHIPLFSNLQTHWFEKRVRNCSVLRKCGVCASVKQRGAARLTDGKRQQEKRSAGTAELCWLPHVVRLLILASHTTFIKKKIIKKTSSDCSSG